MPCVATEASSFTIYADDPEHLWNRLHRTLFSREWKDGTVYGLDDTQLLYWHSTKHLTTGDSHAAAVAVLDEFLDKNGEALIEDPLKRAMLQLDLWALFDWTARADAYRLNELRGDQLKLQKRLIAVMKRIALTREQIAALPNNYALAVDSDAFPPEADMEVFGAPYLPPDLFDEETGQWVRLYGAGGEQGTERHVRHTEGRSHFWVFLRTPGGRDATWNYMAKLRDHGRIDDLPQFPVGTQAALVEQATLIDTTGDIVATPLTLRVQVRAYKSVQENIRRRNNYGQALFELVLHRTALFNGEAGGLVAASAETETFSGFGMHDFDVFEMASVLKRPKALRCGSCHQGPGVNSFFSRYRITGLQDRNLYRFGILQRGFRPPVWRDRPVTRSADEESAIAWKKRQYSWGRLEALWMTVE